MPAGAVLARDPYMHGVSIIVLVYARWHRRWRSRHVYWLFRADRSRRRLIAVWVPVNPDDELAIDDVALGHLDAPMRNPGTTLVITIDVVVWVYVVEKHIGIRGGWRQAGINHDINQAVHASFAVGMIGDTEHKAYRNGVVNEACVDVGECELEPLGPKPEDPSTPARGCGTRGPGQLGSAPLVMICL